MFELVDRQKIQEEFEYNFKLFSGIDIQDLPPNLQLVVRALMTSTVNYHAHLQDQLNQLKVNSMPRKVKITLKQTSWEGKLGLFHGIEGSFAKIELDGKMQTFGHHAYEFVKE